MERDPSDAEDLEKVRAFLGGNPSAFEFLFDKYREKVYGTAFRFVRDKEDALEITQEVFLRVSQGLARFKTDSKFYTWLYRITVNRAIDFLRSRKARPVKLMGGGEDCPDPVDQRPDPRGEDPARALEVKELGQRIEEALSQLSAKHQAVFLLHAVQQLSYKEIAEVVGCNIGTVMSRLFYARKKLQQILAESGTL